MEWLFFRVRPKMTLQMVNFVKALRTDKAYALLL